MNKHSRTFTSKAVLVILWTCTVALCHLSLGCDEGIPVDCYNAFDKPPQKLLEENEFVLTGELIAIDTVAYLGLSVSFDYELDNYLMEYRFRPLEVFKPSGSDSVVQLWHRTTVHLATGFRAGLLGRLGDTELVYGNSMDSLSEIANTLQPHLLISAAEFSDMVCGRAPIEPTAYNDEEIVIGQRLLKLDPVELALASSTSRGVVLYGTDLGLQTNESFHLGDLMCCDSATFTARKLSAEEYLEELRELVE